MKLISQSVNDGHNYKNLYIQPNLNYHQKAILSDFRTNIKKMLR